MRWFLFLVACLVLGAGQMLLGPRCPWPAEARGAFLFVLAWEAAWRFPPGSALALFWSAGLAQDFFLGWTPGVSTLPYALAAVPFSWFRQAAPNAGAPARWAVLFAFLVAILSLVAAYERLSLAPLVSADGWLRALGSAALSLAAAPLLGGALDARRRGRSGGGAAWSRGGA